MDAIFAHSKPQDFFLFNAGFGDDDADSMPKKECFFDWTSGKPELSKIEDWLIPATSIKGAIAHRVAYHYNLLKGFYIDSMTPSVLNPSFDVQKALDSFDFQLNETELEGLTADSPLWDEWINKINALSYVDSEEWEKFDIKLKEDASKLKSEKVGEDNQAVSELFGFAKDSEMNNAGLRGRVIINDIYLKPQSYKVLNHTKIDRFTGGTIDGALFSEKVAAYEGEIKLEIWVENIALQDAHIKEAFEKALEDIKNGQLQLGGNTTKGHGVFKGTLTKV